MSDSSSHSKEVASRLACQRAVQALIRQYDWGLLPERELVTRVWTVIHKRDTQGSLEELVKHQYIRVIYEACCQATDQARRERAYEELFRILYRVACQRWPDLVNSVVQRGLELVYQQLDRCHDPATFLAFALNKLRQAATEELRVRAKTKSDLPLIEVGSTAEVEPPHIPLHQAESLRILISALERLPNDRQQKAIIWKYFEGMSDQEIGARLGITANYVRKLRHDGLTRLRQDQQLKDYFL